MKEGQTSVLHLVEPLLSNPPSPALHHRAVCVFIQIISVLHPVQLTLLGGVTELAPPGVFWDASFCPTSTLVGGRRSGASNGSRLFLSGSAGTAASLRLFCGAHNASGCDGSDWLFGRLLHPGGETWEFLCGEANSFPLKQTNEAVSEASQLNQTDQRRSSGM